MRRRERGAGKEIVQSDRSKAHAARRHRLRVLLFIHFEHETGRSKEGNVSGEIHAILSYRAFVIVIIGTSVVDTCSVDRILIHLLSMVNIKMCVSGDVEEHRE